MHHHTEIVSALDATLRRMARLGCGILLIAGMSSALAADFIYTVQPGDHPWNLAQRYLKRPGFSSKILELNRISDDRRLMPGARIRIPQEWIKLQSAEVRLVAVYGETTVRSGDSVFRAAVPGELLHVNSSLRTGGSGSATLAFSDGSRVLVGRDSELRMAQAQTKALGGGSVVELVLLHGSLENQVVPVGDSGGRFEIQTPAAVAAVRGTNFRARLQGRQLRTEVLSGAVGVSNARGNTGVLAGQGTLAEADQAPVQAIALLPEPSLDGVPVRVQRLPMDVPLPRLQGAMAYRTQLSPDAGFSLVISDEISTSPRLLARDVPDGNYVVRVRAVDAQGLEGLHSQRALVVHARPEPPLLIAPEPSAVTETARPMFRWTQSKSPLRYRLQLLDYTSEEVKDEQLVDGAANAAALQDLPAGQYRWRVAAIDPVKGQGPWGDPQEFRRVMPGPGVALTEPSDGKLTLRWSAQAQTARYFLQLARDDAFVSPVIDTQTDVAQYQLSDLTAGEYWVRVRSVGVDGYVGPWGSTQRFVVPETPRAPWWPLLLILAVMGAI